MKNQYCTSCTVLHFAIISPGLAGFLCVGGRFGEENSRICAFSASTLMTASVCASVCVWHCEVGPPSPRQRERNRGRLLYTVELSAVCSSGVSQAVIFGLNGAYVKERPVAYFVTYVADIR